MKKQPGISHKYFPFTWCNVKKQMGSIRYSEFLRWSIQRVSSEEPLMQDALNKPRTLGRDERQLKSVRWVRPSL